MCGVGSAAEAELSSNKFSEILDIPLPEINMNRTDIEVIVSFIQHNFNDMLTEGEISCLVDYYNEKLNHESIFNMHLYADYLKNSSEHPISNIGLTARELYDQAPGVHDFIDKMQGLTVKYSTLSHNEKVQFLITKPCSDAITESILNNATDDEIRYFIINIDFNRLLNDPELSTDVGPFGGYNHPNFIEDTMLIFNTKVYENHLKFLFDDKPSVSNDNINFNDTMKNLNNIKDKVNGYPDGSSHREGVFEVLIKKLKKFMNTDPTLG
jgi:hypothetical protein